MTRKFTYKEFSIVAGIIVAMIILFTLWLRPLHFDSGYVSKKRIQELLIPTAKAVVEKTAIILF